MSTNDWGKVLIPMIRQILPNMIAADIAGVQPMTDIFGRDREKIGTDNFNAYPYWYVLHSPSLFSMPTFSMKDEDTVVDLVEIRNWLYQTLDRSAWHEVETRYTYYFKREEDRTLFMMRWA